MSKLSLLAESALCRTDSVPAPTAEWLGPPGGIEDLNDKIEDLEDEVRDLGYAHGKMAAEMAQAREQIRILQLRLRDQEQMTELWRRRAGAQPAHSPCMWCGAPSGQEQWSDSQIAEVADVDCADESSDAGSAM